MPVPSSPPGPAGSPGGPLPFTHPRAAPPDRMPMRWPQGPLDAAARAFDLLTRRPVPLAFDTRGVPGMPQRVLPLDELRAHLLADATPRPVRDAVWRDLVVRARRDGPAWVVAAAGLALPGLRRRAGRLGGGWDGEREDLESALLLGFLERLRTIDLDAGTICGRLIDAGAREVRRSTRHSDQIEVVTTSAPGSGPPPRPWDHPEFVLARAVAAAVIGPEEHLLISQTRLGEVRLQQVAEHLGVSYHQARNWRRRGEHAIREAIREGELAWVPLRLST